MRGRLLELLLTVTCEVLRDGIDIQPGHFLLLLSGGTPPFVGSLGRVVVIAVRESCQSYRAFGLSECVHT